MQYTPEYLKTHQFTPEELTDRTGSAIAYLASKHGNPTAAAALHRVNLEARQKRERELANAEAALAAQRAQDGAV